MRTRWAAVIVMLLMGWTLSAVAGPQIGIGDPNCNSWHSSLGPLQFVYSSNSFSVTANSSGGGFFGICNKTDSIWTTVDIRFLTGLTPGEITCGSTVFLTCEKTPFPGGIDLFFSGTKTHSNGDSGGIPDDQLMTINLYTNCDPEKQDCSSATGGWSPGLTMYGGTNQDATIPTPEPATVALLGCGLLGVWQYRRRRK